MKELHTTVKRSQELICYSDADFAGDEDERRSTTGYVAILNGESVTWASRRQKTITLSITEVELMAASQASQEVERLRQIIAAYKSIPEEIKQSP